MILFKDNVQYHLSIRQSIQAWKGSQNYLFSLQFSCDFAQLNFFGNIANKIPQFTRKLESTLKNSFLRHSVRPYFSQTFAYFIYNMYFYVVFRCDFISRTIKTFPFPNTDPYNLCHYRHSCSMVKHCLV